LILDPTHRFHRIFSSPHTGTRLGNADLARTNFGTYGRTTNNLVHH